MKQVIRAAAVLVLAVLLISPANAVQTVIPGGNTIGLRLQTEGVTVVEFSEKAAEKAGLERGDLICAVNGQAIQTVQELTQAVQQLEGKPMRLTVRRGENEFGVTLAATQTQEGWRLGVFVRDSINGIGTVTYYDPATGQFGALGHGISDGNNLIPLRSGEVMPSLVASVHRGKRGEPGTLQGAVQGGSTTGEILENTPQGVFGTMEPMTGQSVEVAKTGQIHTGNAIIRSNVRGTQVEEFTVRIRAIYPDEDCGRNLLLEVTDPKLLELTGGIVQGMSGSPILQNGKLVGAVTHVLIDDPTRGYGIFIENMLAAAQESAAAA